MLNNMWTTIHPDAAFVALSQEQTNLEHRKAILYIRYNLSTDMKNHIVGLETAKEAWDKPAELFRATTVGAVNRLKQQLSTTKRNKGEDPFAFINRLTGLRIQLKEAQVVIVRTMGNL